MRVVIGIDSSNISPVTTVSIRLTWYAIVREVIGTSHSLFRHHRNDVRTDVVAALWVGSVGKERCFHGISSEDVVTHRNEGELGIRWHRRWIRRLLMECLDGHAIFRQLNHTEFVCLGPFHSDSGDRHSSPTL